MVAGLRTAATDQDQMASSAEHRNVFLLATCQALFNSTTILVMTFGGLVGQMLAPSPGFATVPVGLMVVGTVISTVPASFVMRRIGRRAGFQIGATAGMLGGLIGAWAISIDSFIIFSAATMLVGVFQAFAHYYRFAAADVAGPVFRPRAISLVMAGGIVAAFLGPFIARSTRDSLDGLPYAGSFLALAGLGVLSFAILSLVRIPRAEAEKAGKAGRPMSVIARQPAFIVAILSAAIGYGVMVLAMTATPLAMVGHDHSVDDASVVIQWHVLGMFAPSFFTGSLIARFGVQRIILTGAVLLIIHVGIAVSGITFAHYLSALFLLGIGWNFTFIGGTTLLTRCHTPAEKAKVQGLNEFLVFGTVAVASFSSGALLHNFGWQSVNIGAVPVLVLILIALAWMRTRPQEGIAPVETDPVDTDREVPAGS